jgi:hypothetical protein
MWASYFHKNSFHYFEDYLIIKLTLELGNKILVVHVEGSLPSVKFSASTEDGTFKS